MMSERRISEICSHLVGTRLEIDSVLKKGERDIPEIKAAIEDCVFIHHLTGKWTTRYVAPKL